MSETSDGAQPPPQRTPRPAWFGPVVIVIGLVLLALLCIGLSIWGP